MQTTDLRLSPTKNQYIDQTYSGVGVVHDEFRPTLVKTYMSNRKIIKHKYFVLIDICLLINTYQAIDSIFGASVLVGDEGHNSVYVGFSITLAVLSLILSMLLALSLRLPSRLLQKCFKLYNSFKNRLRIMFGILIGIVFVQLLQLIFDILTVTGLGNKASVLTTYLTLDVLSIVVSVYSIINLFTFGLSPLSKDDEKHYYNSKENIDNTGPKYITHAAENGPYTGL